MWWSEIKNHIIGDMKWMINSNRNVDQMCLVVGMGNWKQRGEGIE
jgi:hypothetical protein